MMHGENQPTGPDAAAGYKSKLGVYMFFVYALIYVGFVAINVIDPNIMETKVFFGLNLAAFYGFGLILLALILALIYDRLCHNREVSSNTPSTPATDGKEG